MNDQEIVDLYWIRSEDAIKETANKYGNYCYSIAQRILQNEQDSEECLNDTYLRAWNAIPPRRPENLAAFLGKITRNLALNCYEKNVAQKRGGGNIPLVLEELQECISSGKLVEEEIDERMLTELLNKFLGTLPTETRKIFMRRYWYFYSIQEIAKEYGIKESKVKMSLHRSRKALKRKMKKEGYCNE